MFEKIWRLQNKMLFEDYNLSTHSITRDITQWINEFQPFILGANKPPLLVEKEYYTNPTFGSI